MGTIKSPREIERCLRDSGFEVYDINGGHTKWKNPADGRTVTIPSLARSKAIGGGNSYFSLRAMLRQKGVKI